MSPSILLPQSVLILADEAAEWEVAGLRQIDRTALAVNDLFRSAGAAQRVPMSVVGAAIDPARRAQLTHVGVIEHPEELPRGHVLVLGTRAVLARDTLSKLLSQPNEQFAPAFLLERSDLDLGELAARLHQLTSAGNDSCLQAPADIPHCAKQLFQRTGKSQDGIVSRLLNRPLSRSLSQRMVHLPLSPSQWTLLLMALPIIGGVILLRGDHLGFAIGAVFFQLHSALDGCDGEIARVKYEESEAGAKLDGVCDRLSTLLFAVCLGFGLSRLPGNSDSLSWFYAAEGIVAALFIGVTETLLTRKEIESDSATAGGDYGSFVAENRDTFNQGDQLKLWMIKNSGMLSAGNRVASFFGELTKRDVFNFVFMLLAICGFPQLVLHILALCACLIVVFGVKEMLTPQVDANSAA